MIDPLKTVNKDVLPRFLVSGFYHDFQMRMASVKLLPPAKDLVVHGPVSALSLNLDMDVATLEEIKKVPWRCDRVLYEAFKDYLTSIVAVELLLCVRKIANYQQLWTEARSSGTLENHPCAFGTPPEAKLSTSSLPSIRPLSLSTHSSPLPPLPYVPPSPMYPPPLCTPLPYDRLTSPPLCTPPPLCTSRRRGRGCLDDLRVLHRPGVRLRGLRLPSTAKTHSTGEWVGG